MVLGSTIWYKLVVVNGHLALSLSDKSLINRIVLPKMFVCFHNLIWHMHSYIIVCGWRRVVYLCRTLRYVPFWRSKSSTTIGNIDIVCSIWGSRLAKCADQWQLKSMNSLMYSNGTKERLLPIEPNLDIDHDGINVEKRSFFFDSIISHLKI